MSRRKRQPCKPKSWLPENYEPVSFNASSHPQIGSLIYVQRNGLQVGEMFVGVSSIEGYILYRRTEDHQDPVIEKYEVPHSSIRFENNNLIIEEARKTIISDQGDSSSAYMRIDNQIRIAEKNRRKR